AITRGSSQLGGSMRRTFAPKAAKNLVATGPARTRVRSRTVCDGHAPYCWPICLSRCWAQKTTITGDLWIGHGLLQGADPIVDAEPHARAAICKWARCARDSASISRQSTPRASAAAL